MGYWGGEEEEFGLSDILAFALAVLLVVIVFSVLFIVLSPLDVKGMMKQGVELAQVVVASAIVAMIVTILLVYIPSVIRPED